MHLPLQIQMVEKAKAVQAEFNHIVSACSMQMLGGHVAGPLQSCSRAYKPVVGTDWYARVQHAQLMLPPTHSATANLDFQVSAWCHVSLKVAAPDIDNKWYVSRSLGDVIVGHDSDRLGASRPQQVLPCLAVHTNNQTETL